MIPEDLGGTGRCHSTDKQGPKRMCAVGSVDETEKYDQRTSEPYEVSLLQPARW